jgi:hypothetical protein
MDSKCHFGNKRGQVSIVGMKLSHRNLDPLGRKKGGGSTLLGDKGFPSLPAVVENHCPLLFIVVSHISAAMCGVVVDVEGELFFVVELMVRTTQSAEARVSCSEVRG